MGVLIQTCKNFQRIEGSYLRGAKKMVSERGRERRGVQRQELHPQWSSNAPVASHFLPAALPRLFSMSTPSFSFQSFHISPSALLAFYHSLSLCLSLSVDFHHPFILPNSHFRFIPLQWTILVVKPVIHSFLSLPSISLCLCSRIASLLKLGPQGSLTLSLSLSLSLSLC